VGARQEGTELMRLHAWFMHDDHTFSRLRGNLDETIKAAKVMLEESPYGALCPLTIVDDEGRDVRRVGQMVHSGYDTGRTFNVGQMIAWRAQAEADSEVMRLFEETHAS
jgi:hypothetical protein